MNCKVIIIENVIIYDEMSKKLFISSNCNASTCHWTYYNKEGYVFIDSNDSLVTNLENQSVEQLYKCKKNNDNSIICYDMRNEKTGKIPDGYYYNNNDIEISNLNKNEDSKGTLYQYNSEENTWKVQNLNELKKCTYHSWKNNVCYISYEDEDYVYTSENPKINAESVCVSNNSKLYFAISEINTGTDEYNCIMLPADRTVNYYRVNHKVYAADQFSFYAINEYHLIDKFTSKLIDPQQSNFIGILEQDGNSIDKYTISCNSEHCIKENTIFCEYDFQSETCISSTHSIKAGKTCTSVKTGIVYLILENLKKLDRGRCVPYTKNPTLSSKGEIVEVEFTDRKYVTIDKNLYYLDSESKVHFVNDGVYILDQWNYKVNILKNQSIEIGPNSDYIIFICHNEICNQKEKCQNGDLYEYIYDSLSTSVYQCDPLQNKIKKIENIGYFLNHPTQNLIQCYIDYNYILKCVNWNETNGMEGYYVNAENNNKIIKCIRNGESFSCKEDIIKCSYDLDGKCTSNVDLLRNSYCYSDNTDSENEMLKNIIYVDNYIRAGDYGNCILNDNHEYYLHRKKSKFLGHSERNDFIRFSSDSIVSIYETTVGYYIISTENGKGIFTDTPWNKSRMYKCEKQNCIEEKFIFFILLLLLFFVFHKNLDIIK